MPRIAIVDNDKLKDMQLKLYIQSICPVNRSGKECIKIEGQRLTIDEALCTGCGICVKPSNEAIKIINLPEEWKTEPIHRYGENLFALYQLPTPTFGSIVGILGVNGIGKSTAIKILAQILKPNLGHFEKEGNFSFLIEKFKGNEAQRFFQKIIDGKIKISYKPQQVELIPKNVSGKVRDLLKKIDSKNNLEKIAEELGINLILDHNIDNISGGELQRVAIAACALKDANLFIIDEPSSFLDIKQRINLSKFIKSLSSVENSIIIVEHDLIIFDYLTDYAHLMYGSQDAYGVVSGIKPTKNAINTYLSGYLKEENVRFRDKKIRFEPKAPLNKISNEILIKWQGIEKKLGNFNLKALSGQLYKSEVVGVLGENGIGKTSFVKILAQETKQDKGLIDKNISISYKPQYLFPSEKLVSDVLKDALKNYDIQLINPLNIKPLLLKKLSELSGGELQRVSIAMCLSKDSDLYLIDEPSAYLDIEQRLLLSRLIRDFIQYKNASVLIVDHDLLFIDYISNRLLVFRGKPAVYGVVEGPFSMEQGMNVFLKELKITLRRDELSNMPRINKEGSVKDREQKIKDKYYYV